MEKVFICLEIYLIISGACPYVFASTRVALEDFLGVFLMHMLIKNEKQK